MFLFKKGLKGKFIGYSILVVLLITFSFLALFVFKSNSLIKEELTEVGFALVKSLSYSSELGIASEDEIFLKPYLERIFEEEDVVLVAIYNDKGKIIVSNKKAEIEERMPREVMDEILNNNRPIKRESFRQDGKKFYDFYSPILISEILALAPGPQEELAGFARVGLSLQRIAEQNTSMLAMGLLLAILLTIVGVLISFLGAQRLLKPISVLEKGAEIIGKGNLNYRIKLKTGDEIEELAKAFNKMTKRLSRSRTALEESKASLEIRVKARTKELKEMAEGLEDKVEERTKELQERIDELEKFHRLTVGRELKMVELKKKVKELKQKGRKT